MSLVSPSSLHPQGPEGPAKQGAGVAPSARHRSTVAGGSWSPDPRLLLLHPLLFHLPPPRGRPAGRQQEGLGGQEAGENGWNGGDTRDNRLL